VAVVLDTSFVYDLHVTRNADRHARAVGLFRDIAAGRHGACISNDYVYAECNAFATRMGPSRVAAIDAFFFGEPAVVRVARVDHRMFSEARRRMLAEAERGLTLTDWAIVVQSQRHKARVATFDGALGRAAAGVLP